jgi:molybdopterin-guanine dinucleotide biosynthesis protein A
MELKIDNATLEQLVKEHVKAAVAGVLAKNTPVLIERFVHEAMNAKDPRGYHDDKLFDQAVVAAIHEEAKGALNDWIAEQRPVIRKIVYDQLTKKRGLAQKLADGLVAGLSRDLTVETWIKGSRKDE